MTSTMSSYHSRLELSARGLAHHPKDVVVSVQRSEAEIPVTATTLSSRELSQAIDRAKNAATHGPVFITDVGEPTHVLLSIEEYHRLTQPRRSLAESLSMPGLSDIEFDPTSGPPRT